VSGTTPVDYAEPLAKALTEITRLCEENRRLRDECDVWRQLYERHARVATVRSDRIRALTSTTKYDGLRDAARQSGVKGTAAIIIKFICDGRGTAPLANLRTVCHWTGTDENCWNGARRRLNQKLHPYGWTIETIDHAAVARRLTKAERPDTIRSRGRSRFGKRRGKDA